MEETQEPRQPRKSHGSWSIEANLVGIAAAALLVVFGALAVGYSDRQRAIIGTLISHEAAMSATLGQMQSHFDTLAAKLDEMSAGQSALPPTMKPPHSTPERSAARSAAAKDTTTATDRWKEIHARVDQQQRQMDEMQANLEKTRSDFDGNLRSTHDELTEAIAKTHEELVALEKRGERSYFEFDLSKSKEFQRSGPLLLSLRNTDPKHQNFDLAIVVNDNTLTKKKVNLYEPVWVYQNDDRLPTQVIINKISKELVHGYVSAPKYNQEELASKEAAAR